MTYDHRIEMCLICKEKPRGSDKHFSCDECYIKSQARMEARRRGDDKPRYYKFPTFLIEASL